MVDDVAVPAGVGLHRGSALGRAAARVGSAAARVGGAAADLGLGHSGAEVVLCSISVVQDAFLNSAE